MTWRIPSPSAFPSLFAFWAVNLMRSLENRCIHPGDGLLSPHPLANFSILMTKDQWLSCSVIFSMWPFWKFHIGYPRASYSAGDGIFSSAYRSSGLAASAQHGERWRESSCKSSWMASLTKATEPSVLVMFSLSLVAGRLKDSLSILFILLEFRDCLCFLVTKVSKKKIRFYLKHFIWFSRVDPLSTDSSANGACTFEQFSNIYFHLVTGLSCSKYPQSTVLCLRTTVPKLFPTWEKDSISVARISWLLSEVHPVDTSCLDSAAFHWRRGLINAAPAL